MHDNLTVPWRCTCQPRRAHVESGCLSGQECCANRHQPHRPRRAKPTGLDATDFISSGSRGQGREWESWLVHLNIANSYGPQTSRDSGKIRRVCDFLMAQQLGPRADGGIGQILYGTLPHAMPAGRSLSRRAAQCPQKRKSRIADPKNDHANKYAR
jgi:hypothetical protein